MRQFAPYLAFSFSLLVSLGIVYWSHSMNERQEERRRRRMMSDFVDREIMLAETYRKHMMARKTVHPIRDHIGTTVIKVEERDA